MMGNHSKECITDIVNSQWQQDQRVRPYSIKISINCYPYVITYCGRRLETITNYFTNSTTEIHMYSAQVELGNNYTNYTVLYTLTLLGREGLAPPLISSSTVESFPLNAALCSAVSPNYKQYIVH